MATVINNPPAQQSAQQPVESNGNGSGFLVGIILLILFVLALIYYGLPYLNAGMNAGTQVNVPDKVDVNVKQQP